MVACGLLLLAGCELTGLEPTADEEEPPYQDLDAGGQWPSDSDTDDDGLQLDCIDEPCDDAGGDGGSLDDAGACLEIASDSYQVSGSCPGLPTTGAVYQGEACGIEIPGDLGAVLGETGTVSGPYVTTTACSGLAQVDEFPTVELTCLVDDASCQATLTGGVTNAFDD